MWSACSGSECSPDSLLSTWCRCWCGVWTSSLLCPLTPNQGSSSSQKPCPSCEAERQVYPDGSAHELPPLRPRVQAGVARCPSSAGLHCPLKSKTEDACHLCQLGKLLFLVCLNDKECHIVCYLAVLVLSSNLSEQNLSSDYSHWNIVNSFWGRKPR